MFNLYTNHSSILYESLLVFILSTVGVLVLSYRGRSRRFQQAFLLGFARYATIESYKQSLYPKGSIFSGKISACLTQNLPFQTAKGETKISRQEW
jgi:hypothetical protein